MKLSTKEFKSCLFLFLFDDPFKNYNLVTALEFLGSSILWIKTELTETLKMNIPWPEKISGCLCCSGCWCGWEPGQISEHQRRWNPSEEDPCFCSSILPTHSLEIRRTLNFQFFTDHFFSDDAFMTTKSYKQHLQIKFWGTICKILLIPTADRIPKCQKVFSKLRIQILPAVELAQNIWLLKRSSFSVLSWCWFEAHILYKASKIAF